jgi:hypothetical protein
MALKFKKNISVKFSNPLKSYMERAFIMEME